MVGHSAGLALNDICTLLLDTSPAQLQIRSGTEARDPHRPVANLKARHVTKTRRTPVKLSL